VSVYIYIYTVYNENVIFNRIIHLPWKDIIKYIFHLLSVVLCISKAFESKQFTAKNLRLECTMSRGSQVPNVRSLEVPNVRSIGSPEVSGCVKVRKCPGVSKSESVRVYQSSEVSGCVKVRVCQHPFNPIFNSYIGPWPIKPIFNTYRGTCWSIILMFNTLQWPLNL